jgi:TRAP-type C4-dicarboxylate transport system substrate-binding protein
VVRTILPEQQKALIEKMKKSGVVFTYPDKKPFMEATLPVRDELGTKRWGKELYQKIVEIGKQKL